MADQSTAHAAHLPEDLLVSLMARSRWHVADVADACNMSVAGVARAVRDLETGGVLVAEARGSARLIYVNARQSARSELRALLRRIARRRLL